MYDLIRYISDIQILHLAYNSTFHIKNVYHDDDDGKLASFSRLSMQLRNSSAGQYTHYKIKILAAVSSKNIFTLFLYLVVNQSICPPFCVVNKIMFGFDRILSIGMTLELTTFFSEKTTLTKCLYSITGSSNELIKSVGIFTLGM